MLVSFQVMEIEMK